MSWNPEDYGIPRGQVDELWFETADGAMLYGWYCRSPRPVASALYCHGNTGNLTNAAHVMPHLLASGINVLLFDYRGYGKSSGFASLGGVVADALAAARFHDQIRPKYLPSILFGYSLGGAVAVKAIRRHSFDGLILQSTFTSLPDIARVAFPRVPVHWISGRVYDSRADIRDLDVPLLIIHGENDETCPRWMGEALYEACGQSRKQIHVVKSGLHKDLWEREGDALVWEINRFAAGLTRRTRPVVQRESLVERIVDSTLRALRRHLRVVRSAPLH